MLRSLYILFIGLAFTGHSQRDTIGSNPRAGNYFTNNGAKIYFEVYGKGTPLLIIHGNGGSVKNGAPFIRELSQKYKVIAMDSRCHGNSQCPSGSLTYTQIANDANALVTKLKLDSVYVWGHSDGAIVGLLMAIHYPGKIKRMLASGGNLRPDTTAVSPEVLGLVNMLKQDAKDSLQIKLLKLLFEQPNIPIKDLHKITADVLVMCGDRDVIRNDHALEIFNNIPKGFLCILPGTTHFVAQQRYEWFFPILYDFFDNPLQRTTTIQMMKQRK